MEVGMPIVLIHRTDWTQKEYERASEVLAGGVPKSPSDWPVEGLLSHAAGPVDGGWCVVDVWKDRESAEQFGQILQQRLSEAGLLGEGHDPVVYEAYNFVQ
jgi:hypothetical protein